MSKRYQENNLVTEDAIREPIDTDKSKDEVKTENTVVREPVDNFMPKPTVAKTEVKKIGTVRL